MLKEYLENDLQERIWRIGEIIKRLEQKHKEHPQSEKIKKDLFAQKGFIMACKVILTDIKNYKGEIDDE